ncbi:MULTISPECIES: alpha/beta hydrolase family protein [Streptomyces]|uniref:alpha/beta hydrolase family protein n=1 Tax=Streptomyces TaxID=1883 RepID=UPI001D0409FE|nr:MULTISPECIES: alpha/beta hydrolase [Streptomyces]
MAGVLPEDAVSGTAGGVPFTALPPARATGRPAPLLVGWHMMEPPRTDAAFAAALPLAGLPAWRVYLGMPWCGAREPAGGTDAAFARATRDGEALLGALAPVVDQAVAEFPGALAELRSRLPLAEGPPCLLGASLGGAVALTVLAAGVTRVRSAAVVNAGIRARSVLDVVEAATGLAQPLRAGAREAADRLDLVARAGEIATASGDAPLLVVSGERDYPALRADATALVDAVRAERAARGAPPGTVRLLSVPGLAHPLAEPPGTRPAPQLPLARAVDAALTAWFAAALEDDGSDETDVNGGVVPHDRT